MIRRLLARFRGDRTRTPSDTEFMDWLTSIAEPRDEANDG